MIYLALALLSIYNYQTPTADLVQNTDISFKAQHNLVMMEAGGDEYEARIDYTFYTTLKYNENVENYIYEYNGFNINFGIYDESNELIYEYNESYYEEVTMNITNSTSYMIGYRYDNEDLKITFIYGLRTSNFNIPIEELSDPWDIKYNESYTISWTPIVENIIPALISSNSYDLGYNNGYTQGNIDGNSTGYNQGYATGYKDAEDQDSTAVTIFSGILSVGLLPVNFFLAILNFEVFGINIGAFVSALLTVAIVVIVTRMVVNGGNGKD